MLAEARALSFSWTSNESRSAIINIFYIKQISWRLLQTSFRLPLPFHDISLSQEFLLLQLVLNPLRTFLSLIDVLLLLVPGKRW